MIDADIVVANKVVYLTYSILDQAGKVFERSHTPLGYVQGENSGLFKKVETALLGRRVGDSIQVTLAPAEGFGEYDPLLAFTDALKNIPPADRYIGAEIEFRTRRGEAMNFWVRHIDSGKVLLDANHPLAGQTVSIIVTVVGIREASAEELASGLEASVAQACAAAAARTAARSRDWLGSLKGFFARMLSDAQLAADNPTRR